MSLTFILNVKLFLFLEFCYIYIYIYIHIQIDRWKAVSPDVLTFLFTLKFKMYTQNELLLIHQASSENYLRAVTRTRQTRTGPG